MHDSRDDKSVVVKPKTVIGAGFGTDVVPNIRPVLNPGYPLGIEPGHTGQDYRNVPVRNTEPTLRHVGVRSSGVNVNTSVQGVAVTQPNPLIVSVPGQALELLQLDNANLTAMAVYFDDLQDPIYWDCNLYTGGAGSAPSRLFLNNITFQKFRVVNLLVNTARVYWTVFSAPIDLWRNAS